MTINMQDVTQAEIKEYAERISKTVVIRTYDNGSSHDTRRKAKKAERELVYGIVSGALLNIYYSWGSHNDTREHDRLVQVAADTAEYTFNVLQDTTRCLEDGEEYNGYDTVYLPIKAFINHDIKLDYVTF